MTCKYKRIPEARARMSEARKRAWADPEVRARRNKIPAWVPVHLHDEFIDMKKRGGVKVAKDHCRVVLRRAGLVDEKEPAQ